MSTHRSQILMPGCIDWTRLAIEVEVLFNHQPFIDVSVFCWLQIFLECPLIYMFNILNFPLLTTMHIKIWRLIPLVMEKWFYCQYGTSTCRMVNCFHLMNAFTDRINVLKFIFWQMYHIKWNCQLEYHVQPIYADLPHVLGKDINLSGSW